MTFFKMEKHYLKNKRRNIYTMLEEADFDWSEAELKLFDQLWKEKASLSKMAEVFNRKEEEIILLALDRFQKRKVTKKRDLYVDYRSFRILGTPVEITND